MTAKVTYTGNLRTHCVHLKSGDSFITDAPTDNNGLGAAFSPTDTIATGLASCILTIMGVKARDMELDLTGSEVEVTKHMASNPRRISKIELLLRLPAIATEKERKVLEHTAHTCPVHHSLHPDIEKHIEFRWEL
ncbi:OsmC family protein [Sediminicola luteus]|uniref:Osmotically inducible protein OsmC n=1 Tax=Sediminicola luteus TaxID=319238 RepID=A0A2A4G5H7_9FLAO|nr:OsmC family protein [Sediminicola luteus]PCE64219.1 osmotically inducible protein OsmC [Sediminicola luteus]